jgi:hypothetical protein
MCCNIGYNNNIIMVAPIDGKNPTSSPMNGADNRSKYSIILKF